MNATERDASGLRPIRFEPGFTKQPDGSCFVRMGNTWVLCTASVEESVPPFLKGKGRGWVTAEYSMLPGSTRPRTRRTPDGRAQEIQRLIGRSLRACLDLPSLGERSILIDCDVLQADGGTRTAAINGGFMALTLAVMGLQRRGTIATSPIRSAVGAVSAGMKDGSVFVDLDYDLDSSCDVDMNVVMLDDGRLVEIQGTAERKPFTPDESREMLQQASNAVSRIFELQREAFA